MLWNYNINYNYSCYILCKLKKRPEYSIFQNLLYLCATKPSCKFKVRLTMNIYEINLCCSIMEVLNSQKKILDIVPQLERSVKDNISMVP